MFTFGILSSHLPYVAFVAVYLFYLLMPSQFKQLDDSAVLADNEKCIQLTSDTVSQHTDSASSYFYADNVAETLSVSTNLPLIPGIKICFCCHDIHHPDFKLFHSLFSRPPPIC